jgi:hypothetical protein
LRTKGDCKSPFQGQRIANPLERVGLLGPIGFGISMTYFVIDVATDSFNGWGKIQY